MKPSLPRSRNVPARRLSAPRRLLPLALLLLLAAASPAQAASVEAQASEPTPYGEVGVFARCAPGASPGRTCEAVLTRRGLYHDRAELEAGTAWRASFGSCEPGRPCENLACDAGGCSYGSGDRFGPERAFGSAGPGGAVACFGYVSPDPWCVSAWTTPERSCVQARTGLRRETTTCLYPIAPMALTPAGEGSMKKVPPSSGGGAGA